MFNAFFLQAAQAATAPIKESDSTLQIIEIVVQGAGSAGTIGAVLFAAYVYGQDKRSEQFAKIRQSFDTIPGSVDELNKILALPHYYNIAEDIQTEIEKTFPNIKDVDDLLNRASSGDGRELFVQAVMLGSAKSGVDKKLTAIQEEISRSIRLGTNMFPTITKYLRTLSYWLDDLASQCFRGSIFVRMIDSEENRKVFRTIATRSVGSGGTLRSGIIEALALAPHSSFEATGQHGFDLAAEMVKLVVSETVKMSNSDLGKLSKWDKDFYTSKKMAELSEVPAILREVTDGLRNFLPPDVYTELVESRTLMSKLIDENPPPSD